MQVFKRWPAEYPDRLQLFSMNTPNGIKISVVLEETGLLYEPHLVNILKGDQHTEEFTSISPNSKIPAIVDPDGPGGATVSLMESGAILIYLAEKTGMLLPTDPVDRHTCLQWLFFQVGHVGPMFGQFGHFYKYARDKCRDPYPLKRYSDETRRLLGVLERQLARSDYVVGPDYTIADIAIFPWVDCLGTFYEAGEQLGLAEFANVRGWLERCKARPAFERGRNVCAPEP